MSRGGRGGGRGRGGRKGLFGAPGEEPPVKVPRRVPVTFPPVPTPVTPTSTLRERDIIRRYRELRSKIRKGPFYTVLSQNASVAKPTILSAMHKGAPSIAGGKGDGFSAMHTYSSKYRSRTKTMPRMRDMSWLKDYIPGELHASVDRSIANPETGLTRAHRRDRLDREDGEEGEEGEEGEAGGEEDQLDVELDENWEEDEEDGDDYNAEQYFDNGEDEDFGGDDDAGGGGDYE